MNLIIDIGNTIAKIALFKEDKMMEVHYIPNQTLEGLQAICAPHLVQRAIVATVIDLSEQADMEIRQLPFPVLWLNSDTRLPVINLYQTPETLGYDRIAAAIGAHVQYPNHNILVIDAGTCITYEFIDALGQYHGGNIAPGLEMRFKALHQFTGRLPMVSPKGEVALLGKDTETAIRSGVIKGIEHEIIGYMMAFKDKYSELLVFLTGGNEISFDTNLKSAIFADRFLVLKGLNRILNCN